jgi:homoserine kinase
VTEPRHHAVSVPATSANLGPGFDAFGLALDPRLTVASRPRSSQQARVELTGEGGGEISDGDDNLVWRSLIAFCNRYDAIVPEVALRVHNEVPLERGMGSSSTAIVAGLALARALTGVAVGDRQLVVLADQIEGHPDNVAPALLGGLVACARGDDGGLVVRRVNPSPRLRPLLLVPESRQLTTEARAVLPESLERSEVVAQAARAGHVLAGLIGGWPVDPSIAGDLLHEPARLRVMRTTGEVVTGLRAAGVHAWLSGAGPSVAAMVPAADEEAHAVAREVATRSGFAVRALQVDLAGTIVCPEGGCGLAGGGGCVQCPRRAV